MSRHSLGWLVVVVGLVAAGAVASYFQQDSFVSGDEEMAEAEEAVATLVAVGDCPWGEASCILAQAFALVWHQPTSTAVPAT